MRMNRNNADSNAVGAGHERQGHLRCSEREPAKVIAAKRQISRMLVAFCVREKHYSSAAEIVSGGADIFSSCSRRINEILADVVSGRASWAIELVPLLQTAKAEVVYHEEWTNDVLATLPDADNSRSLNVAFREAGKVREKLNHDIALAYTKYREVLTATSVKDRVTAVEENHE